MLESPAQSSVAAPPQNAAPITRVSGAVRAWPVVGEHTWLLLLLAVFVLGLGLRLNCLDCYSLWYDEIASVETAQRGWEAIFGYRFGWVGNQTPLHYLLVWLTAQAADPAETAVWVRLPSVLAGALLVPVTYRLGALLFTRAHGLVAALLVALTPTLLDYSQELRPYSMMTFLTLLSVLSLVEAVRGGSAWWWSGFVLSTVLNILNSPVALMMVMPPLGLYLLWCGWRLWRIATDDSRRSLRYLAASLGIIGAFAVPTLFGLLSVPRYTAENASFTLADFVSLFVVFAEWFTQIETGPIWRGAPHYIMLALAVAGGYLALKSRKGNNFAALPLLFFTLIPLAIFAYFMSRYYVTPRYVLFSAPFFLLLISYALLAPVEALSHSSAQWGRAARVVATLPLSMTLLFFAWGALSYATPEITDTLPDRPDYRSAARYMERVAGPDDVIVFADHNALGYMSAQFYWRNSPPVPVYDARDPRLASYRVRGDVIWVFGSLSAQFEDELVSMGQGWHSTARFRRILVVKEPAPDPSLLNSVADLVKRLRTLRPEHRPFIALEGNVHQARGEVSEAATDYHAGGQDTNQVLGSEYLRTAKGFAARGRLDEAWREAAISKFMWPSNPDLYAWMGEQLRAAGREEDALVAEGIASQLAAMGSR